MTQSRSIAYDGPVGGDGPTVIMIPSLGRAGGDFDALATRLGEHGFATMSLTPRVQPADSPQTFEDLADDVAAMIRTCGKEPVHLVGHAYGQALARCIAARHPEALESLSLLACGGSVPDDDIQRSLAAATDVELARTDRAEHLRHVARAFFAPGNDASMWAEGWYGDVAEVQMETMMRTPFDRWRSGAVGRTLVIQGIQDAVAPPEHGRAFLTDIPTARLVEIDGAGHALLPERPEQVAAALLAFLRGAS